MYCQKSWLFLKCDLLQGQLKADGNSLFIVYFRCIPSLNMSESVGENVSSRSSAASKDIHHVLFSLHSLSKQGKCSLHLFLFGRRSCFSAPSPLLRPSFGWRDGAGSWAHDDITTPLFQLASGSAQVSDQEGEYEPSWHSASPARRQKSTEKWRV